MTRCRTPRGAQFVLLLPLLLGGGCDTQPASEATTGTEAAPRVVIATGGGTIRGRVVWQGAVPVVPAFEVRANPLAPSTYSRRHPRPNPNAPHIDPVTQGVGEALVWVRLKDNAPASPWPHPPVRVVMDAERIQVQQGGHAGILGLVRAGDAVEFHSTERQFHSLRARGAAFFSLAFAEPEQPLRRTFTRPGIVELSSGSRHYWMQAYLVVTANPACTLTAPSGDFVLPHVPPGEHEVVCWLPNWRVARQERDPEAGVVSRITFQPPLEVTQRLRVVEGRTEEVHFTLPASPDDIHMR